MDSISFTDLKSRIKGKKFDNADRKNGEMGSAQPKNPHGARSLQSRHHTAQKYTERRANHGTIELFPPKRRAAA